jgi:hypothetical protein
LKIGGNETITMIWGSNDPMFDLTRTILIISDNARTDYIFSLLNPEE